MAHSLGPERSFRFLGRRESTWHRALVGSAVLHGLIVALAVGATRGRYQQPARVASQLPTRAYAMIHLLPPDPPSVPNRRPQSRPASRPAPPVADPIGAPDPPAGDVSQVEPEPVPVPEPAPDTLLGLGSGISPPIAGSTSQHGSGQGQPRRKPPPQGLHGVDRGAELLSGVGSACPELRRPAWASPNLAVSVGFVVGTDGRVDPETLRVVQSPSRRQRDNWYYSHIYTVAAAVREVSDRLGPAAYDSLVTRDVADHVVYLMFRPALRAGRAVRSTVLVSCQMS